MEVLAAEAGRYSYLEKSYCSLFWHSHSDLFSWSSPQTVHLIIPPACYNHFDLMTGHCPMSTCGLSPLIWLCMGWKHDLVSDSLGREWQISQNGQHLSLQPVSFTVSLSQRVCLKTCRALKWLTRNSPNVGQHSMGSRADQGIGIFNFDQGNSYYYNF